MTLPPSYISLPQESLQNSLLRQMDPQAASEADLREAFCRYSPALHYTYHVQYCSSAELVPQVVLQIFSTSAMCNTVVLLYTCYV